jgi:uncharacterized protein (UPF0147 family)
MNERTNEVVKKLQRLSNDRVIPRNARNQIQEAINYLKSLDEQMLASEAVLAGPKHLQTEKIRRN